MLRALILAVLPATAHADTLTVFAAASLQPFLDTVASEWQEETGDTLILSYGGSGTMAQQILRGAPADLFISASPDWMDAAGVALIPGTRRDILGNALVLISAPGDDTPVALGPDLDLAALLGTGRLALGEVTSVPAGQYAQAALTSLGLWDGVADRTIQTDSVRSALRLVATGEAPFGIVYLSDTIGADVDLRATVPADTHPPITYPAAAVAGGDETLARAFLGALSDGRWDATATALGFTLP